jgi:hypothetical protein
MVAVITSVLAGSGVGLLAAVVSWHSLVAALLAGGVVAVAALWLLMRYQRSVWQRAGTTPLFESDESDESDDGGEPGS